MTDHEKIDAADFSEMLFNTLQNPEGLVVSPRVDWPWEGPVAARWGHNQAEDAIRAFYDKFAQQKLIMPLAEPLRIAWAPSPAALYTAVNMLRGVQAGMRHKFIEALVPHEDPIASAKRTLLDAIINRDVTVTMGASMARYFDWRVADDPVAIRDLENHLRYAVDRKPYNPLGKATPATFNEGALYPVRYNECIGVLQATVFMFLPYLKICWLCHTPVVTECWPNGHLKRMLFTDGYEVRLADPEVLTEDETKRLRTYLTNPDVIDGEYTREKQ